MFALFLAHLFIFLALGDRGDLLGCQENIISMATFADLL